MKKAPKKGRGRPPLPPKQRKAERLEIRVVEAEREAYQNAAGAAGLETSEWIRRSLNAAAKRQLTGK